MTLHAWWLFVVAVFLLCGTPGPNMLHVMTRSIDRHTRLETRDRREKVRTACRDRIAQKWSKAQRIVEVGTVDGTYEIFRKNTDDRSSDPVQLNIMIQYLFIARKEPLPCIVCKDNVADGI